MQKQNEFDGLIRQLTQKQFPRCDWRLIKAQVAQESSFDPEAQSPVGAQGLMQLMPATDKDIDGDIDGFDPAGNLDNGIRYFAEHYYHFPEIEEHDERLKFALASYNCGRAYVNKAIELAYQTEFALPMPKGHLGARPGKWQRWGYSKEQLKSPLCSVRGKRPDWKQSVDYVDKIWSRYQEYKKA